MLTIKQTSGKISPVIIALMGPTGTGKSTFIDYATLQIGRRAGHTLRSCTSGIRVVKTLHPMTRQPVYLVDTPGFNDTNRSDTEILSMIAVWLEKTYKNRVKLSGIIYLHRISDNRMAGSPLKNLQIFYKLCGNEATRNVILATTMWSRMQGKAALGARREADLGKNYWRPMLENGSRSCRFGDSFQSAWDIIDSIVKPDLQDQRHALLLQEELVDLNRRLNETEAGKALYVTLQHILEEQKETIRRLREEVNVERNETLAEELTKQYQELEDNMQRMVTQLAQLRISLGRRILMLFSLRKPRSQAISLFLN